jgi:excisionase family DNA binding protein
MWGVVEMSTLPDKDLLRVDEVAEYFDVHKSTIYLWIDHGILVAEKYRGILRVPRESIEKCRTANKITPLE